jgi:hypothetical protein
MWAGRGCASRLPAVFDDFQKRRAVIVRNGTPWNSRGHGGPGRRRRPHANGGVLGMCEAVMPPHAQDGDTRGGLRPPRPRETPHIGASHTSQLIFFFCSRTFLSRLGVAARRCDDGQWAVTYMGMCEAVMPFMPKMEIYVGDGDHQDPGRPSTLALATCPNSVFSVRALFSSTCPTGQHARAWQAQGGGS